CFFSKRQLQIPAAVLHGSVHQKLEITISWCSLLFRKGDVGRSSFLSELVHIITFLVDACVNIVAHHSREDLCAFPSDRRRSRHLSSHLAYEYPEGRCLCRNRRCPP